MLELARKDWTLIKAVREQARRLGERKFLTFEDGAVLTFSGLERESDELARALAAKGVGEGDRVLALLTNGREFLPLMIATHKLGAVFVTVNTELRGSFLEHQLRNSEPRVVLVDRGLVKSFAGIDVSSAGTKCVVLVGAGEVSGDFGAGVEVVTVADLAKAQKPGVQLFEPGPAEVCTVIYTSGTTGPSKGVLIPHAHAFLMADRAMRRVGVGEDDTYYICMPMFHSNALFMQTFACLLGGGSAYVVKRFSPNRWLEDVRRSGATLTNGLGVIPEFIFRTAPTPHDRDHKLRTMMAVPIANEWGSAFQERFGVKFVQGYGMTEINIIAYGGEDDELLPGLAGPILTEFFDVRIFDENDDDLPQGSIGEIVVRPKVAHCFMAGYQRMPEKTIEAWKNLWFHTGDAGKIDERGRLHFIDRIKDCIRRRGENISSFEVEQVINSHPVVAECAVFAVKPADAGGEDEVKACVVLKTGAALEPVALLDYCQDRMPRFAVPRFVEIVPELAKTATGKLQKEALKKSGITPTTWDRESVGYKLKR